MFEHPLEVTLSNIMGVIGGDRSEPSLGGDKEPEHKTQKEIIAELNLEMSQETFVQMVIRVQRAFRLATYVYRHFGPTLFVDSTGCSCYGQIKFEGHLETAPWVRVAPSSSPIRLVKLFDYHWKLPKPEVIIDVTGGALDFALTSQQLLSFDRGLCSAALSAKAWIFSAGSDTGVMRLVGDAMARHEVGLPLIGIFPWGVTNGRGQLSGAVNGTTPYRPSPSTREGVPLNPNHTHFVLVDNGTEGGAAFGSEINLRASIVTTLSNRKNVPIVQLVVQGGPGTLQTVLSTAMAGKPIVILIDSGGAATAIYDYCSKGLDGVEPKFKGKECELRTIMQLNEAYGKKQLTFYRLSDEGKGFGDPVCPMHDMSSSLLDAIVKMMNSPPIHETLPVGAHVRHPDYGFGSVTEITITGARVVLFDDDVKMSIGEDHVWTAPRGRRECRTLPRSCATASAHIACRTPTPAPSPQPVAPTTTAAAAGVRPGSTGLQRCRCVGPGGSPPSASGLTAPTLTRAPQTLSLRSESALWSRDALGPRLATSPCRSAPRRDQVPAPPAALRSTSALTSPVL